MKCMENSEIKAMNKQEIDECFVILYVSISEYSIKALKHFRSKIDLDVLLSETYIYVERNKDKIYSLSILESFCKNFIKKSITWSNSELNRKHRKNDLFYSVELMDYHAKCSIEPDYSRVDELTSEFHKGLTNYERRLFNIWFNLEKKTGKEISQYLNISLSLSYRTIKECKVIQDKFRQFIVNKL